MNCTGKRLKTEVVRHKGISKYLAWNLFYSKFCHLDISLTEIIKGLRSMRNLNKVVVWQSIDYDWLVTSSLKIWSLFSSSHTLLVQLSKECCKSRLSLLSSICCFYFYSLIMKMENFAICYHYSKFFIITCKNVQPCSVRALCNDSSDQASDSCFITN